MVSLPASSTAMTLSEALIRAYDTNPALEGERARLRATDEGVPQASSKWRPTVSVSGSYGMKRSNSTSNGPSNKSADVTQPATGSLTITQDIYRGGRTFAARKKAEHDVQADRARLSVTEQNVLLNTATGYADVVRDQAVLDLNRNNEVVLWRQLEATQDRFRVGDITLTDVSRAESRLSRAQAERIAAKGRLSVSRASLENMVGTAPGKLQPGNPLAGLPATLENAIQQAKKTNFTVVRADFLERAARTNVRTISGELLPTVSVNGSFSANDETTKDRSQSESVSVTAKVSIPLYSSGSVRSRIRAAKEVVSQRRDEFSQAIRDAVEATTAAWQTLQTSRAQIHAFGQAIKAAEIALEGLQEEAKVGSRTVLDVLDAEQELLDARVGLVGSKRDELLATFQLRHALGDLTVQKLGLPVKIYNVETHYRDVRNKWWGLDSGRKGN
ncbi:MAG: TolC family outer membrane protein [Pseudomonadota bacterium]|nr:TolC family outer membrane protein [Pseudomonadota bacterium]